MKQHYRFRFPKSLAVLSVMSMVVFACGDGSEEVRAYSSSLSPINPTVQDVFGVTKINLEKDNLDVSVNLVNAPTGTHIQRMTIGDECPTIDDDKNGDGYVDAVEAEAVTGKALIPFDGDLSSQEAGADGYPVDSYQYTESTSLTRMLGDLLTADPNPEDSVVKITAPDQLSLEGKAVIVHGVPAETVLPASVQSIDNLTPQLTLPIACGLIAKNPAGGTTTGGTTTGGTTTGGTTTGGTTTGGTTTGGTTTSGTTTGGTTTGETTGGTTGL